MSKRVLITPTEGKIIRDPASKRVLKEEGEERTLAGGRATNYWKKRLADGDVTFASPVVKNPVKAKTVK